MPLGELTRLHHGVRGNVFAVDARTLHIRDFHYDGEGPGKQAEQARQCVWRLVQVRWCT